jgi:hypothetical protein
VAYGVLSMASADWVPHGCQATVAETLSEDEEVWDWVGDALECGINWDALAETAPDVPRGASGFLALGGDSAVHSLPDSIEVTFESSALGGGHRSHGFVCG